MAWVPLPTASQCAIVVSVEAITVGRSIHAINRVPSAQTMALGDLALFSRDPPVSCASPWLPRQRGGGQGKCTKPDGGLGCAPRFSADGFVSEMGQNETGKNDAGERGSCEAPDA